MEPRRIRPLAVGTVIHEQHLLLGPVQDSRKAGIAYRPLGGEIEFGEVAASAIVREFREELGRGIEVIDLLGVSENLFTFEGEPGHEVVFEFLVRFSSKDAPTSLEPIPGLESNGAAFVAVWLPLQDVIAGRYTVYPDGFRERLAAWMDGR